VIEITLPCIEYVKSAVGVVESDEPKMIFLLSFTYGSEIAKTPAAESSRELQCFFRRRD